MNRGIRNITIKGFKSFRKVVDFKLNDLNIIIGANGAGKSNFIQIFHMLSAMINNRFSDYIRSNGGADSFLFNGPKETSKMEIAFDFISSGNGVNSYDAEFRPTVDSTFLLSERRRFDADSWRDYGDTSLESRLPEQKEELNESFPEYRGAGYYVYDSISNWMVYHFHDTSPTAPMRRYEIVEDNKRLRENASNIAPFLLNLRDRYPRNYDEIRESVRLVMPFFDDFILDPVQMGDASKVRLTWKQKGSDFPMQPYHLSDGSIRFICLAAALIQPDPPSTIVIDEPELGLHPAAISILAELLRAASKRSQIIAATQSPLLIDQFGIDDIIVMGREKGASVLKHLDPDSFSVWLEDYSVGELWTKNVLEGGPVNE